MLQLILNKLLLAAIKAPHSLHISPLLLLLLLALALLLEMQADGLDAGAGVVFAVVIEGLPAVDDQGPVLGHHGVEAVIFLLDVVLRAILVSAVEMPDKAARSTEIELD